MRTAGRVLIALGAAGLLGGIAGFCYILFVYPAIDPPFEPASGNLLSEDGPPKAAPVSADGFARVGVRFHFGSDIFYNRILNAPRYHVRYSLLVDDADTGARVFEESAHLDNVLTFKEHVNLTPEGGAVTSDAATHVSVGGDAEQHLTAFPVRAGQRLLITCKLPEIKVDYDAPMGETESNVGAAEIKEVFLLQGDYDPAANLEFRADGPTTALQVAGVGILTLIIGGIVAARAKP